MYEGMEAFVSEIELTTNTIGGIISDMKRMAAGDNSSNKSQIKSSWAKLKRVYNKLKSSRNIWDIIVLPPTVEEDGNQISFIK